MTSSSNCLLKISNNNTLKKFLHECVDELAGKEQQKFHNSMDDIELSSTEHKIARNYVQNIFRSNIFEEDFKFSDTLNELSNMHADEIMKCFSVRRKDIYQAVMKEQLLRNGVPLVENIDWRLKWIMGSSKLASLSEPVLQISLNCIAKPDLSHQEQHDNHISFEVTLSQLDDLIEKLEHVKKQL